MRIQKFYFVAIAILTLALTACGGGGGSSSGSGSGGNPTTAAVEGIWTGSYSITGGSTSSVTGAIAQSGYGFFYDSNGFLYTLPMLTGSTTFSGTLTGYAPAGQTFQNGQTTVSFNVTGTASGQGGAGTSIQGTFSTTGESGSFTLAPYAPFTGTASLAGLAGQWNGFYVGTGSTSVTITINSSGTFTGNDGYGCTISGTLTQVQTGMNLYSVAATSSGQAVCVGSLSGLGYESSTDAGGLFGGAAGTYFYVGASNATSAFAAEFKLQ